MTYAMIAVGARISDHSAICGPLPGALGALPLETLFIYGSRREAACRKLANLALAKYDERGIFRTATTEAVQIGVMV